MRKTVVFVAVLLVSLLFAMPAYAAGEWNIPELDMKISLPEEWIVFTRNMDKNDPNLKTQALTYDELMQEFDENKVYLDAWQADTGLEIIVTMLEDEHSKNTGDYNRVTDESLNTIGEKAINASSGVFQYYEIYKHDAITYLFLPGWKTSFPKYIYIEQYSTVVNGQSVNITLQSFNGPIAPEYRDAFRGIVDSIEFDKYAHIQSINPLTALAIAIGLILGLIALLIFVVRAVKKEKECKANESLGDK